MGSLAFLAGADIGMNLAKSAWDKSHDKEMQDRQMKMNSTLNRQMSGLSQEVRQSSASDMVQGLRRAGLSTALANGVSFGATSSGGSVSAPSSPSHSSSTPLGSLGISEKALELENLKYQQSQRALMEAQTDDLKQDVESKKIENARNREEDVTVSEDLKKLSSDFAQMFSARGNDDAAAAWQVVADYDGKFNVGTIRGLERTNAYRGNVTGWLSKASNDALSESIASRQLQTGQDNVLASMPTYYREKLIADCANIYALTRKIQADTSLTLEQKHVLASQVQLNIANAKKAVTESGVLYHSDVQQMYDEKDILGVGLYAVGKVWDLAEKALPMVGGAALAKSATSTIGQTLKNTSVDKLITQSKQTINFDYYDNGRLKQKTTTYKNRK